MNLPSSPVATTFVCKNDNYWKSLRDLSFLLLNQHYFKHNFGVFSLLSLEK